MVMAPPSELLNSLASGGGLVPSSKLLVHWEFGMFWNSGPIATQSPRHAITHIYRSMGDVFLVQMGLSRKPERSLAARPSGVPFADGK